MSIEKKLNYQDKAMGSVVMQHPAGDASHSQRKMLILQSDGKKIKESFNQIHYQPICIYDDFEMSVKEELKATFTMINPQSIPEITYKSLPNITTVNILNTDPENGLVYVSGKVLSMNPQGDGYQPVKGAMIEARLIDFPGCKIKLYIGEHTLYTDDEGSFTVTIPLLAKNHPLGVIIKV